MAISDWINTALCLATLAGAGFGLMQFWITRSEEKEKRLQDREHKLALELAASEKTRVDTMFASFAAAMKQIQNQQKETVKDFQSFAGDLRAYRVESQNDRTIVKIEMDHIKESVVHVREEIKSVAKYIGEGKIRISGPKF